MNLAWVAQGAHPVAGTVSSESHTIFWCGFTSTRVGLTSLQMRAPFTLLQLHLRSPVYFSSAIVRKS